MAITICHKDKVEDELKKLQEQGVIEPVKFSKWAVPIVPVLKHDRKSIRICGDYKLTANKAVHMNQYPIPKIDNLLSTLVRCGSHLYTLGHEPSLPAVRA